MALWIQFYEGRQQRVGLGVGCAPDYATSSRTPKSHVAITQIKSKLWLYKTLSRLVPQPKEAHNATTTRMDDSWQLQCDKVVANIADGGRYDPELSERYLTS